MKILDWLDEQEAQNVDVSEIVLPKNIYYDEDPDETISYKEIKPCGLFCRKIIPFLQSNTLGTGISVGVKIRKPESIHQK